MQLTRLHPEDVHCSPLCLVSEFGGTVITDFLRWLCGFKALMQAKPLDRFGAHGKDEHQLLFFPGGAGWPFTHTAMWSLERSFEVGRASILQRETEATQVGINRVGMVWGSFVS